MNTRTREAILRRLNAYVGKAVKAGAAARVDILALAEGVSAVDFEKMVTAEIAHLRLGKVMTVADRVAVIKVWRDKGRIGGKIGVEIVATTLGVVPSTVSVDANSTDDGAPKTESTKTDADKVNAMTLRARKIATDNDGAMTPELAKAFADMQAAIAEILKG